MIRRIVKNNVCIPLVLMLGLIAMPAVGEALAAQLEIDDRVGTAGSQVVFTVSVQEAPNQVNSLGIDITYCRQILEYVSCDFTGTLMENWPFKGITRKEITDPADNNGILRLGGVDLEGFAIGISGDLVKLTFRVIGVQECQLSPNNLVDDISGWSVRIGAFTCINVPTVTTQAVSNICSTLATGNGNVTNLGVPDPTEHGVCWNTTGSPTTVDSCTTEGSKNAVGPFTSLLTGLVPGIRYFVKAYVVNLAGTSYGGEVSFTTPDYSSVAFVDKDDATCGGKSPCYTSIQGAINAATTGSFIRITQGTYGEAFVLNADKSITLQGGWDSNFQFQSSNKTIIKAPGAPKGSLTLQMVTINP